MLPRTDGRADLVASVDTSLCVSCGICAGSCAPMGVGPPGRTGRDQLEAIRRFMAGPGRRPGQIIVMACGHGAGVPVGAELRARGAAVYPADCAGNLHTSVIEFALRSGAGGVLVLSCPPRDCTHREGPRWLIERMYHDREAELQARVDRSRIAVAFAGPGDRAIAIEALTRLQEALGQRAPQQPESDVDVGRLCEPAAEGEAV
jgi:coenzyme F420-reducing hydrogenase delta subunit